MFLVAMLAHGFGPVDMEGVGIEPQRVQWVHAAEQARQLGPAFDAFRERHGQGWHAQRDEANGTLRALWGEGIPVVATEPAAVGDEVLAFVERYAGLFGLGGQLSVTSVNHARDTWYVDLGLSIDGVPVYRGGVRARVKHGRLVLMQAQLHGDTPVTGAFQIGAAAAQASAIANGPAPAAEHTRLLAVPMLLEQASVAGLELRKVWEVRSSTTSPVGHWVSHVDAETGAVLHVYNEIAFVTGTVEASHHVRTLNDPLVSSPLPGVVVTTPSDSAVTDEGGVFDVQGSPFTTDLEGTRFVVRNAAGAEAIASSSSPDLRFDSSNSTLAESSVAVFLHDIRNWGLEVAPEIGLMGETVRANVNLDDACNAYFDPYGLSVNFFSAGFGCSNTGQIADVVYHEWGHGFHLYSLEGGFWDGSMGEGIADVVATLQTGDDEIGPTFNSNGSGIRQLGPDERYPDDFINNYNFVHSNGLIFGGAMWDLWQLLQDDLGEEAGTAALTEIFTGLIKGGPDVPGSYLEALLADDDDGDLINGTPHQCQIVEAFGRHGLGPAGTGAGALVPIHLPVDGVVANEPVDLEIRATSSAPGCFSDLGGGELFYRVDGGDWASAGGAVVGDHLEARVPAQPLGSFVEYWAQLDSDDGSGFAPMSGEIAPYSYFVGDVLPIRCDDFEADDGGYTHELVRGENVEGADDWQWGKPNGNFGDPSSGFSGNNVWGNDLGYDNYNGAYQDGKRNRLSSPVIDTGHYTDVFLHYARWLNVEDGAFDTASIWANGEKVWTNWEGGSDDHTLDGQWIGHAVDLQGEADQGEVELRWELNSDDGLFFGGWNIDDVCLFAPATTDNRMGITDFALDVNDDGSVDLEWTNPPWAPLEQVKVIRNGARRPESHEDGIVVYDDDAPELGAFVEVEDPNTSFINGYYAVYGFDGEAWLSWTVDGWNADDTDGDARIDDLRDDYLAELEAGGAGGADGESKGVGCGCTSTGAVGMGWLVLPMLGLALRRR